MDPNLAIVKFQMVKWYRLTDWITGPFVETHPESDLMDFILYADWFNFNHESRLDAMWDIRHSHRLRVAPTRLGVIVEVQPRTIPKRWFGFFIRLYDTRVIEPSLFRLMTIDDYFAEWAINQRKRKQEQP